MSRRIIRTIVLGAACGSLAVLLPGPVAHAADVSAGKSAFRNACGICHSAEPGVNKIGPTLFGIMGRQTGSVPGYSYSAANRNAHITWTPQTMDKYLQGPRAMIPGTKMTYMGVRDPEKRANIIAYLATLK